MHYASIKIIKYLESSAYNESKVLLCNEQREFGLKINSFIASHNIEVIDIKFSARSSTFHL